MFAIFLGTVEVSYYVLQKNRHIQKSKIKKKSISVKKVGSAEPQF